MPPWERHLKFKLSNTCSSTLEGRLNTFCDHKRMDYEAVAIVLVWHKAKGFFSECSEGIATVLLSLI